MDAPGSLITVYLDTSALVRLVFGEGDVALVKLAIQSHPISSVLTRVEAYSSIARRCHGGSITEEERDILFNVAETGILSALTLLALDDDILTQARRIVVDHPVRTLDALHLATVKVAERHTRRHGRSLRFCTADRRQADAARTLLGESRVVFIPPLSA